jgi:Rhomboid family
LNNLIFLILFGNIVGDLVGDRRVLPLYLLGGLVGNLLFVLSGFLIYYPVPYALGASGAVMALAGAVLILAPDYRVMLLLLGEVKVKYVILVLILLDMVALANNSNTGGHIAHLGGFFTGIFSVYALRDGRDFTEPINRFTDWLFGLFSTRKSPKMKARVKPAPMKATVGGAFKGNQASDTNDLSYQEKLDAILDKIKQKGIEGLTPEEKNFLAEASKR